MSRLRRIAASGMVLASLSLAPVLTPVTASAAAPTAARVASHGPSYQVRRGDNLWRIARRNHTTVKHLVELNAAAHPSLKGSPHMIMSGWSLKVS